MSAPAKSKKTSSSPAINKVRIRLKSFDARLIDSVTKNLVHIITETGAEISGPIPLPTKRRRYCVNSSTHVDKRSGEHFEVRVHSRLIEIINPLDATMTSLQKMDLPSGVGVKVQVVEAKK